MRLFGALFRRKHMPNGHIWRGKDRLYKEVTKEDLRKLRDDLEIEENNMFYLRHAYLTPEQSRGHAQALGKHEAWLHEKKTQVKEFKPNITIESRLAHLRVTEAWD